MQWDSRDSAGEESDEESIEEQIERDESTESLDELGLPLPSAKSSSNPRPCSSQSHLNAAELIVLDFGPTQKGLLLVFTPSPPNMFCKMQAGLFKLILQFNVGNHIFIYQL